MPIYTLGYGGRTGEEFIALLKTHGTRTVADVRLCPDRSAMGIYVKAKEPAKGIEGLLVRAGIGYVSLVELGNLFREFDDWPQRYRRLLDQSGDLLTERLLSLSGPVCLLCAEKDYRQCHRKLIAEYLEGKGWAVEHME